MKKAKVHVTDTIHAKRSTTEIKPRKLILARPQTRSRARRVRTLTRAPILAATALAVLRDWRSVGGYTF